jgi:hypothetical protein
MSTASAQQSRYPDAEIARRLSNTGRLHPVAYVADRITRTISLLNRSTRRSALADLTWASAYGSMPNRDLTPPIAGAYGQWCRCWYPAPQRSGCRSRPHRLPRHLPSAKCAPSATGGRTSVLAPPLALALVAHRRKGAPDLYPIRIPVASVGGAAVSTALDRFLCSSLANLVHPAPCAAIRCESVLLTPYRIAASQLPMEQASFGRAKRVLQAGFKARKQIAERSLGANGS